MASAIRTPNSIWSKLIEQQNAAAKKPDQTRGDAFVYFVGSRGSGKSTLLNRFLYPDRIESPKPSEGLEYTYARKPAQYDHERKDLAHIWEIGGSQELAEEIANGDQIFLTFKQVTTATVVIVVDLSDPSSAVSSALYWLDMIKKKLTSTYEKFEKKGLQLPEQLRTRAKSRLYGHNEDKDIVYHSGISVLIAATKFDVFDSQESEMKKIMARTLRYVAHAHGAHLVYVGGLHTVPRASSDAASQRAATQERSMLENFRSLMNHLIFMGLDKKLPEKLKAFTDHNQAIIVPAGSDKFKDLGRPSGTSTITDTAAVSMVLAEWKEMFQKFFPPGKSKAAAKTLKHEIPEQYKEDEIDAVWKQKHVELEQYKKAQADMEAAKKKASAQLRAPASEISRPEKPEKAAASKSSSRTAAKSKPPKSSGSSKSPTSIMETVSEDASTPSPQKYPAAPSPEPSPPYADQYAANGLAEDDGSYQQQAPNGTGATVAAGAAGLSFGAAAAAAFAVVDAHGARSGAAAAAPDPTADAVAEGEFADGNGEYAGANGYADANGVAAEQSEAYAATAGAGEEAEGEADAVVDPNAQFSGIYTDADGNLVDVNGNPLDPNGIYSDGQGNLIDGNGNYVDAAGNILPDQNVAGAGGADENEADATGEYPDQNGRYADANGVYAKEGQADDEGEEVELDPEDEDVDEGDSRQDQLPSKATR